MKATEARDRLNHTNAYRATIHGLNLKIELIRFETSWSMRVGTATVKRTNRVVWLTITNGNVDAGYICYLTSAQD